MAEPIGVCLVGCGGISDAHLQVYAQHPQARLAAVVDVRPEAARAAATRYGATAWYTDYRPALTRPDVHLVDVCLPHHLHAEVSIAAAEAGKHVFVEKPIANTLEEADAMIAAAQRAGVKLMVDQTKRFEVRHQRVKELLAEGAIGEPLLVKSAYPQDISCLWGSLDEERRGVYWKRDGVVAGIGIHTLDILRYLIGEVAEVSAFISESHLLAGRPAAEESGIVLLRFQNGCIGETTVSYVLKDPRVAASWGLMPLQLYGTRGSIDLDYDDHLRVYSEDQPANRWGLVDLPLQPPVGKPRPQTNAFAAAIDHLLECIRDDREPLVTGEEGRATLEVVIAAYHSAAEGRAIRLPLR